MKRRGIMKRTIIVGSLTVLLLAGGGYIWSQMHARGYG
jgi:hypothetical protein